MSYIYVIQTREFITLKLPIYKIGKTEQELTSSGKNKRMNGYPKDSIQIALFAVSNCHEAEKLLIQNLNLSDDIKVKDMGNEWFEGPIDKIKQILLTTSNLFPAIPTPDTITIPEINPTPEINQLQCRYCLEQYSRKDNLKTHITKCKDKFDAVRILEIKLHLDVKLSSGNNCRFCNKVFQHKTNFTRHVKSCKAKESYKEKLELYLKEKTEQQVAKTF